MTMLKKIISGIALLACAVSVHVSQTVLDRNRTVRFVTTEPVFLPRGRVLKMLSMGYRGLAADALWIRCVLYYGRRIMDEDNPYYVYARETGNLAAELKALEGGEEKERRRAAAAEALGLHLYEKSDPGLVKYIYPLLDRVTTLDPHFIFPYIFGGVYVLIDTGDPRSAETLLLKGCRNNPGEWKMPFYIGWIHWMYYDRKDSALDYLSRAVAIEGCPEFVYRLYTDLSASTGLREETHRYLRGLLNSTENSEVRDRIMRMLEKLEAADTDLMNG